MVFLPLDGDIGKWTILANCTASVWYKGDEPKSDLDLQGWILIHLHTQKDSPNHETDIFGSTAQFMIYPGFGKDLQASLQRLSMLRRSAP